MSAEINLAAGADPVALRHDLDDAFALSCTLGDPCWEGATARAIALTHAAAGDHDKALEWIDQSRRRCLRETDTYVAMHAAILDTEATISAAAGQQRPGRRRPDAPSSPSPRAATWTTSSPEACRS